MHTIEPWLLISCKGIFRIMIAVLVGVTIGTVFECRNGVRYISFLAKPLLRLSRLPEICGSAFITAFISNIAAAGMLAGAYYGNKITKRDMIIGGILNSFPAYTVIMLFVMFILIPIIGKIAIIYCVLVIVLDLGRTLIFLFVIRLQGKYQRTLGKGSEDCHNSQKGNLVPHGRGKTQPSSREDCKDGLCHFRAKQRITSSKSSIEPLPWGQAVKKAYKRILRISKKFIIVGIPLYLLSTYLVHIGVFEHINRYLPHFLTYFLPAGVISIIIAKLAGLTTAAIVAMGMLQMSKITTLQVLLAFFAGNIFDIPIRSIKHNLPIALGIYPEKTGLWIILILESSRMLVSILAVIVLGLMIHFG